MNEKRALIWNELSTYAWGLRFLFSLPSHLNGQGNHATRRGPRITLPSAKTEATFQPMTSTWDEAAFFFEVVDVELDDDNGVTGRVLTDEVLDVVVKLSSFVVVLALVDFPVVEVPFVEVEDFL